MLKEIKEGLAMTVSIETDPKFKAFLEAAPDAIVVVNQAGDMVVVNELAKKMFGFEGNEMLGRPVEILIPKRYRTLHVKHRDNYFIDPHTRPMGEGRELQGLRKDGTEFSIEISLSPLPTEHGVLVMSIIRDITSRKQLEAKFQGLLESAPDGIVVVDHRGVIVIVNGQTESLFGYSRDELIGQEIEMLVPDSVKPRHVAYRENYIKDPVTRPMGAGWALTGRKKDGSEFPVEISLSPLKTEQGTLVTSIIRDITERRKEKEQIQASLREKEALLKEIHHRVKNNLQVTSSLLKLQSDNVDNKLAKELFAESQNRIRSMALVHEKLYRSDNLSKINFTEYIEGLADLLFRSYGINKQKITFEVKGVPLYLSVELAVPCGLLINELISNCLKHAFIGIPTGKVRVLVESRQDKHSISVQDNGRGLPPNFSLHNIESLGLQLVQTLAKQLNGNIQAKNANGALFQFDFSDS